MSAASAPSQTAMKRLAGALSFVCLVLFLLAIEQKQTVAAWRALSDGIGPAARGVAGWAGGLPDSGADGLEGLKAAVADEARPLAAQPDSTVVPGGEYAPADETTRAAVGAMTIVGAELRFEAGERLRTRPLRIAAGRDAFAPGQTFAARLNAPADAQVELREVIASATGRPVPPSALCGGEPAGVAALLHRRARVDVMLFRAGVAVGPDTPPSALCGAWSFTAR
jgi:hypothetical protein